MWPDWYAQAVAWIVTSVLVCLMVLAGMWTIWWCIEKWAEYAGLKREIVAFMVNRAKKRANNPTVDARNKS